MGELSAHACEAFAGKHVENKILLAALLEQELDAANLDNSPITFLVKGSRSAGMETLVEHITTREEV